MKLLGVLVALAVSVQAASLPHSPALVKRVTTNEDNTNTPPGNQGPISDEKAQLNLNRGPGTTSISAGGSGAGFTVQLATKTKANCMYDMNTFVESNLNYGTDGGLYAEMIRNRAFQDPAEATFGVGDKDQHDKVGSGSLSGWQPAGEADLSLVADAPLSQALPNSAKVSCKDEKARQPFGIKNLGFFGMPVQAENVYKVNFWIRSDEAKNVGMKVGLFNTDLTEAWAAVDKPVQLTKDWQEISLELKSTKDARDINNVFAILADCTEVSSFQVNLVSLFPPTYEGTVARIDLAKKMKDFQPKAIRWPGGNDLIGATINSRFQWNATLGPLKDRPGRLGNWHGWNTDGLGVVEMYDFIQKMGARIIVGLWAGADANGNSIPIDEFDPYVQQQVDFVHFLLDTEGKFADLRVKSGGPKQPYDVQAFLIGNEGQMEVKVDYQLRFDKVVNALKAEFKNHPNFDEIDLIAARDIKVPTGYKYRVDLLNLPLYGTPQDFIQRYHYYDEASRTNNTVYYNMEFAVINSGMEADPSIWFGAGRLHHSILQGSLAEGVSILGMENNCDIVRGAAYAPEFANEADSRASQSTPGLLEFDTEKVVSSTSWLVQKLVSKNRISKSIEVQNTKDLEAAKIYVSAGADAQGNVVIKLVNYQEKAVPISIKAAINAKMAVCNKVSGNGPLDSNTLESQPISIQPCRAQLSGGSASMVLDKWSFTVLTLQA